MRHFFWTAFSLAVVSIGSIAARAQNAAPGAPGYHQQPDEDGVYYAGPEVTAPRLLLVAAAGYPTGMPAAGVQGMTVLAMVLGADGVPAHLQVLHTHSAPFDQSAINAVVHSKFEPGRLAGKPVPVWIDVRVVFRADHSRAVPEVLITERDLAPFAGPDAGEKRRKSETGRPPIPIHTVDADFENPFAKTGLRPEAIVTVLVDEQGSAKEVRVKRGLGFGMDQKAEAAARRFRFLPALKKGKPVADTIDVEIPFSRW